MRAHERSIISTIAYADCFDYPLTQEQVWRFLITNRKIDQRPFIKALKRVTSSKEPIVMEKNGWYSVASKTDLITTRMKRQKESKKKLAIAKKISRYLSFIPLVKFVGVSGALAMENAQEGDDIDLFVITKKRTLWITRLAILVALELLGRRRKRGQNKVSNTICVNMLMDESNLSLPKERHDLYSAHEIVQMLPLFDRENTYQRFLGTNLWVKDFLPNSLDIRRLRYQDIKKNDSPNISISQYLNLLEYLAKTLQLWYMKGHRTRELISETLLAFHPKDYRRQILRSFEERLKRYL